MAKSDAVWGIDVGQCALKAIRCRPGDSKNRVVAEAFDFIEYPKILSQPGSDPAELIADALKQFLSRNNVRGDRVAISVAGQAGLARFIKLPPVEVKKIPDIVRFEARQQIPFDLNDVVWDYQRMGGGSEEEGFALETEIGLFAMKRDAVFRALEPFQAAGIEVDLVQLTPLALYNFAYFDLLTDLPTPEEYDPDSPPDYTVVISLGTDATDLVVTNGFRVWQRSVPLGGSHFTKALTKELKLTFAKAEHLKRNAATSQDSKAIYQAMRPVFNDLLTELQRSIGYFTSLNRTAQIGRVVALGNAMKLPGLRKYLSQNLGYEIEKVESFRGLTGAQVTAVPAFRDNILSFGVSYGLALQGLGRGGLRTNLLPQEIVKDRLVRRKKPWAVAAAATLLLACTVSYAGFSYALGTVHERRWQSASEAADSFDGQANQLRADTEAATNSFKDIMQIGDHLVGNIEGRLVWLEMLRVLNECMPHDPEGKVPAEVAARNELHVTNLEVQHVDDLARWFLAVKQWYEPTPGVAPPPSATGEGEGDSTADGSSNGDPAASGDAGPSGPGWVVQLTGFHYHNENKPGNFVGAQYVQETLFRNLETEQFHLPAIGKAREASEGGEMELVSPRELGIKYPVLVNPGDLRPVELYPPGVEADPNLTGGAVAAPLAVPPTAAPGAAVPVVPIQKVQRFDFVVQFAWQPVRPSQRATMREQLKAQSGEVPPTEGN
ncbi:MAG: type IV pilus assembly protein PilM [Planctomycetota bacterium]